MIKPHKYLDLNNSLLMISSEIIKVLIEHKEMEYNELFVFTKNKFKDSYDDLFLQCLNFLYITGVIEYNSISDSLELIK